MDYTLWSIIGCIGGIIATAAVTKYKVEMQQKEIDDLETEVTKNTTRIEVMIATQALRDENATQWQRDRETMMESLNALLGKVSKIEGFVENFMDERSRDVRRGSTSRG